MNGPLIIPNESTKRIGFVNALAKRLYRQMPMDQVMPIVTRLNESIDLPEKDLQVLTVRLVPR
jgi:hypothetical protein